MFGLGSGLIRPGNVTILSLSVSPKEQGAASGWMGTVFPIGHLITPFSIMPLYMLSPNLPYLAISFLALLLIIFIISKVKAPPKTKGKEMVLTYIDKPKNNAEKIKIIVFSIFK